MAEAIQSLPLLGRMARLGRVSPEAAFTIRFAIVVAAALWIGHLPGLITNQSSWILITVLMVAQPHSDGALLKGMLRMFGTLAAAIASILLFGWFSQDPPWFLASFFLVQVLGAYGFSGPRFQYAWFVFAFTTAIIMADAMGGTDAVETVAFQRASMVGIGLLIVFLVDSLFWPQRASPQLRQLASDSPPGTGDGPAVAPRRFQLDPFRVRIALRTGIAVCAVLLAVMSLGWEMNSLVVPVAFMIASVPTRGGATKTLLLVAGIVLLGWFLADVAIVFFHTRVGEMPLALFAPVLIASVLGWWSASRPALDSVRSVGALLALLPVFAGSSAPTDVYGPYSTTCYLALALGIGWASTRLLWPASAETGR